MASTAVQRKQYDKYKSQILQLEDMGFTDRKHSLSVLVDCKGDMDKAVVVLTRNPGKKMAVKKSGKSVNSGAPDLLLSNDDPMGLDSVGDLLSSNQTPSDMFGGLNLGSQPSTNSTANLMQPSRQPGAPGLLQPNSGTAAGMANIQAAMRQQAGQGSSAGAPSQQYQSPFMVGGARQQQQQQQRAPTGPTIGGMCAPQAQQQQQIPPQLMKNSPNPGMPGMMQPNATPGLLQPNVSPAGLLKPNASPNLMQPNTLGRPTQPTMSQPSMSLPAHKAPSSGPALPPGSLSGLGNSSAAPAPAPAASKPSSGFGGLLSQMKDTM